VIIEWGVWNRSERDVLRVACRAIGAAVELRYLDVPLDELAARIEARQEVEPMPVAIEPKHLAEWVTLFEAPDADELALFDPPLHP
jgi:predicted kinase